jgi:hypothetical protein
MRQVSRAFVVHSTGKARRGVALRHFFILCMLFALIQIVNAMYPVLYGPGEWISSWRLHAVRSIHKN